MRRRLTKCARRWAALAVTAVLGLSGRPAFGQGFPAAPCCPPPCASPYAPFPGGAAPSAPAVTPSAETPPVDGGAGGAGGGTTAPAGLAAFGAEAGGAVGGTTTAFNAPALGDAGGYLDYVIPRNRFVLRYDSAFDINRPDRATFIYGAWKELSFHPHPVRGTGQALFDGGARGPRQLPSEVNYQEATAYFELATMDNRFSAFADIPVRYLDFRNLQEDGNLAAEINPLTKRFFPEPRDENGTQHTNLEGLSDIQLGFKAALIASPTQFLTFQLRTYVPTGNAANGMGTGHVSLEPGLLLFKQLTDRMFFQGQARYWVPLTGDPVAGDIFIYGAGLGVDAYRSGSLHIVPITEVVGWTVMSGFQSVFGPMGVSPASGLPTTHGVSDASGNTIVNVKFGARTYFGAGHDVYMGWGHAVTGDRWYRNILRVEYRYTF